jgi:phenylalanyl-tRNA synthetase beta chain
MKLPLSWIKDYVDIEMSVEELARRMTLAGLEVEELHYVGYPLPTGDERRVAKISGFAWEPDKIVVGAIHEVMPHPDADKLVLCKLDDGETVHTVLTGAPNLYEFKGKGPLETPLMVAYAREGATIINAYERGDKPTTLKRKKIRGVDSYSMACSERELGISEEHEGIIILDNDAPVGVPLVDYLGDVVFDIAITPNMARDANVIGVAREIAAVTGTELRYPDLDIPMDGPALKGRVKVEITDPELNPRFVFGLIEDVTIQPSPYKIQMRLKLSGMRPIDALVDATNYAMLEIGEPLHAFDYDILQKRAKDHAERSGSKIEAPTIITRPAKPGEKLVTLDDVERTLDDFTVLVTDQSGSLALAGVMGGLESEVTENTTNVLLEGAAWNMINTRRTVMAQNLPSEAAYRFSRGVHPEIAPKGVLRGLKLMHEWAGGTVAQGLVDEYPLPPEDPKVEITPQDVRRWLGIDLDAQEIIKILESLEFECELITGDQPLIDVQAPDHRLDIGTGVIGKADLMEEIARVYGYDIIPETRLADDLPPQKGNLNLEFEEAIRDLLVGLGLQEIITHRMTSPEREARRIAPDAPADDMSYFNLANPITPERSVMRHSLLASVLEIVERNARLRERIAVFEINPVFLSSEESDLPEEARQLVIALTGPRALTDWAGADTTAMDFFDLKGIVDTLLKGLHLEALQYEASHQHPSFHPGKCARILTGKTQIGVMGELHPQVSSNFDLPENPLLAAEFDVEALFAAVPTLFDVSAIASQPPILEDIAVIVNENMPAAKVEALIRQTGGQTVTHVHLFDVYRGEQIGAGKKSLAYSLTYQSPERTLTDKDAAKLRTKIVKRLEREIGAVLRG